MTKVADAGKETDRLEAFSDGVFAIAMTLLILDVRVPLREDLAASHRTLLDALVGLWPALLAYFMSFAVVLVMWVNHHRIFTVVRRADHALFYLNGLLLMLVTFVPFPTALLSAYMGTGTFSEFRIAALLYAGHATIIGLTFAWLWQHAIRRKHLLAPGTESEVRKMSAQYRWGPAAYLVAFLFGIFSPWASVGVCLMLVVAFGFRGLLGRE
ncbi:MAG TPA: TMEM175 family protein [Vicinamibacterales bacterium]|nr:TMEM175 family protein [Vicinamibacterales bacterium]